MILFSSSSNLIIYPDQGYPYLFYTNQTMYLELRKQVTLFGIIVELFWGPALSAIYLCYEIINLAVFSLSRHRF